MIDRLYPEVATIILFVIVIVSLAALLYISLNWE